MEPPKNLRFCETCDNLLEARTKTVDGAPQLLWVCAFCNETKAVADAASCLVYELSQKADATSSSFQTNPYLRRDPTLPRYTHIPCPNPTCPNEANDLAREARDVVGLMIQKEKLKWEYQCAACGTIWRN